MGCERASRHEVAGRVVDPGMMSPETGAAVLPRSQHQPPAACTARACDVRCGRRRQRKKLNDGDSPRVRGSTAPVKCGRGGTSTPRGRSKRCSSLPAEQGQRTCREGKGQSGGGSLRGAPCSPPGLPPGSVPPLEQRCRSARCNTGRRQPQSLPF